MPHYMLTGLEHLIAGRPAVRQADGGPAWCTSWCNIAGCPPTALLADRLQLIFAPCMGSIALPGMEECSLDGCLLLRISHPSWDCCCSAVSSSSCSSCAIGNSTTLWHIAAAAANNGVGGSLPRCVSSLTGFHSAASTLCFAGNVN